MKKKDLVFIGGNQALTTSRKVAAYFGKEHKNVLQAIENSISQLGGMLKNQHTPPFIKSTYTHEQNGQEYPQYLLNRDGFMLVVMGFTGTKATHLKWNYIQAFNRMEQALKTEWQRLRRTGKDEGRKPLTDAIQRFNLRDFAEGDKNPKARQRYGALTAKSQTNIFGIPTGGRDEATGKELAILLLGEHTMANVLSKAYELGASYARAEDLAIKSARQVPRLFTAEILLLPKEEL